MINIQNIDDNECFKWNIVRYLNPTDRHPERITKTNKEFAKKLDFKNIEFPVKIRNIGKIENKNSIGISAFAYDKEKHQIFVSKKCFEEKQCSCITDKRRGICSYQQFEYFMYDHTFNCARKHFCCYCLQAFSPEEILRSHINYHINYHIN